MDVYGYLWMFRDIYGYLWIFQDVQTPSCPVAVKQLMMRSWDHVGPRYLQAWIDICRHGQIFAGMDRYLQAWIDICRLTAMYGYLHEYRH